ncbi:hypothetical protein L798_02772 [Zootermopsis nevadensis]|uniref:Uncharacterized protein n=2 Tax=Zootermopsis nevadensis TaxID=136037 RepID=A0A067RM98_ZOONE|nr:hypothetical protein L798_02772 [Zootermopsis nevadensis]
MSNLLPNPGHSVGAGSWRVSKGLQNTDDWTGHVVGHTSGGPGYGDRYISNGWHDQGHGRWHEDLVLGSKSIGGGIKHARFLTHLTGASSEDWQAVKEHEVDFNRLIYGKIRSHERGLKGSSHEKWNKFSNHEGKFITKTRRSVGRNERKGYLQEDKRQDARLFQSSQRYVEPSAGDWNVVKSQLADIQQKISLDQQPSDGGS